MAEGTFVCPKCGAEQAQVAAGAKRGAAVALADERETILGFMNNSFTVMSAIKEKENIIAGLDEGIDKARKRSRIRYVVLCTFIGLCIAFVLANNEVLQWPAFLACIAIGVLNMLFQKKKAAGLTADRSKYVNELETLKSDAVLSWLPYDYRDSTSFAYLFSYMNNMRASTLKEAINLYETEKHQARLELISALTAQSAADAAASASSAAGAAAASAFFSLFKN